MLETSEKQMLTTFKAQQITQRNQNYQTGEREKERRHRHNENRTQNCKKRKMRKH